MNKKADKDYLFFDRCAVHTDVLCCGTVYPRMALAADMAGSTDGNGCAFLLMVLYTRLEYGDAGRGMHSYRGGRIYIHKRTHLGYMHL